MNVSFCVLWLTKDTFFKYFISNILTFTTESNEKLLIKQGKITIKVNNNHKKGTRNLQLSMLVQDEPKCKFGEFKKVKDVGSPF